MGSLLDPGGHRAAALADDAALVGAMLRVEVAWVRALVRTGTLGGDVAAAVMDATARVDPVLPPDDVEAAGNPVLPLVKALRAAVDDPAAARAVHRGLTSQDVLDTALMLLVRDCIDEVVVHLQRTGDGLAALAEQHRAAPAAGRTLTQYAVPVTVGLRAAQWLVGVHEARQGLLDCRAALPVQCGGAAGTLGLVTDMVPDPLRLAGLFAEELSLTWPGLPWHTRRTPVLRAAAALGGTCVVLGTLAANVLALGRPEVAELAEGAVAGRGASSTMPDKTNPVLSVLIRSAALQSPQLLAQLYLCAGQVVDERPPGEWHAEWPALNRMLVLTAAAAGQAAELVEGLKVDVRASAWRAEQVSGLLLSERGSRGGGDAAVGSYLGMSSQFAQLAVERWGSSGA